MKRVIFLSLFLTVSVFAKCYELNRPLSQIGDFRLGSAATKVCIQKQDGFMGTTYFYSVDMYDSEGLVFQVTQNQNPTKDRNLYKGRCGRVCLSLKADYGRFLNSRLVEETISSSYFPMTIRIEAPIFARNEFVTVTID